MMNDIKQEAENIIKAAAKLLRLNEDAYPTLRFLYLYGYMDGALEISQESVVHRRAELARSIA